MPPPYTTRRIVLLCFCASVLCSCSALPILAVGDALNVAETGKTGYDMATGLCERKRLVSDRSPDVQAAARLRAALDAQGGSLRHARPVVNHGQAYVLGTYSSPEELARARRATRRIKGVRQTILCLYPAGSGRNARTTDGEMRDDILRLAGLHTAAVRVHVIEGHAVLIGQVRTRAERARIAGAARRAGALGIRDYVTLAETDGKDR